MSTLCFTGPRPKKLYGYHPKNNEYEKIQKYVEEMVLDFVKKGADTFISGGAQGFDMIAFSAVDAVKQAHPEFSIKNNLYLPCLNQGEMWALDGLFGREQLEHMKEKADSVIYVHNRPYERPSDMTDRNHAMVNVSDDIIALYPDESWRTESGGTAECMRYAERVGKPVTRISLEEIMNENKASLFGITTGVICQQVNCQDVYGAGLAKAIMDCFPIVSEKYHAAFAVKTKEELFGKIQVIEVSPGLYVANIFSQFNYGNSAKTGVVYTDADKLVTAVDKICNRYKDIPVYLPHSINGQKESGIGCGLAGESWEKLSGMFQALGKDNLHLLDTYTGKVHEFENEFVLHSIPKYPFCKGMSATGYKMEQFQADLAERYGYKPLPTEVKDMAISQYVANLPECFAGEQRSVGDGIEIAGRRQPLYLKGGVKLANGYDRIVVGHYGAFLEISKEDIHSSNLHIKPGEEYRLEPKYKDNVKYIWLEPIPEIEDSGAKIYHQQKRVAYADYIPGKFYISPYEVMDKEELGKIGLLWTKESYFQNDKQVPQIQLDISPDYYEDRAVVFDTETTGIRNNDELLSIAIVNTDGEILLNTYVKPDRLTSWPDAQKVNHISPEMVKNAPSAAALHDAVEEIFGKASVIVGHNVPFDLRFVKNCIGVDVPKDKVFDTLAYFKKDEPSLPHKLGDAVDYYCPEKKDLYNAGAHSAITDTIVTAHVYNAIMEKERNYDR